MTHEQQLDKWFENNQWIRNFHKLSFMYANGFVGEKTYQDLVGTKIKKFNGQLATVNRVLEEHYKKK